MTNSQIPMTINGIGFGHWTLVIPVLIGHWSLGLGHSEIGLWITAFGQYRMRGIMKEDEEARLRDLAGATNRYLLVDSYRLNGNEMHLGALRLRSGCSNPHPITPFSGGFGERR